MNEQTEERRAAGPGAKGAKTEEPAFNTGNGASAQANGANGLFFVLPPALAPYAEERRWVVWKWVKETNGKLTKPPFQARNPDRHASSIDQSTWATYQEALATYQSGKADGIGLTMFESNLAAFDIDKCRNPETGVIHKFALELVKRCKSYAEVTPSKTGLRIIGTGAGVQMQRKQKVPNADGMVIETFRRAERYITVTGDVLPDTASTLAPIDQQMDHVVAKLDEVSERKRKSKDYHGPVDEDMIHALLEILDPDMDRHEWIVQVGSAIFHAVGDARGYEIWNAWSQRGSKYPGEREARAQWKSIVKGDYPYTVGTLIELAKEIDPNWRTRYQAGGRPNIILGPRISESATEVEQVLLNAGVPIYQRRGKLVYPVVEEVAAADDRKTKVARFVPIDLVYMRDLMCRQANFFRRSKSSDVPVSPPKEIAETILGRVGEWSFPAVAGLISTPTMRPDGSLLTQEGFDPVTRLLLVAPPAMPPIPEHPTREDALASVALLKGLLKEFPFSKDNGVARSVALSAEITPVVRGAFLVAPMHVISANAPGTGKSYFLSTVAAIATGQDMPVITTGNDEKELEKRLGADLLAGQPLISIDNVNGELASDLLCQAIEQPSVRIRILGKSESVTCENRSCIFANGNNIAVRGDLCRRDITSKMIAEEERPELREFKGKPFEMVMANRGAYIAACLTICRAYVVAGRPNKAKPIASFGGWSDTVRSALIWLGEKDPVASMEVARAEDPELNEQRELLVAWAETIGVGGKYRCTMIDVIELCEAKEPDDIQRLQHPRLSAAVQAVAGKGRQADARSAAGQDDD